MEVNTIMQEAMEQALYRAGSKDLSRPAYNLSGFDLCDRCNHLVGFKCMEAHKKTCMKFEGGECE